MIQSLIDIGNNILGVTISETLHVVFVGMKCCDLLQKCSVILIFCTHWFEVYFRTVCSDADERICTVEV